MGPRSPDRENTDHGPKHPTRNPPSMGPRSADRGNVTHRSTAGGMGALQWGRDQLIAEMDRRAWSACTRRRLQWGRDQLIAQIAIQRGVRGIALDFNGAAIS